MYCCTDGTQAPSEDLLREPVPLPYGPMPFSRCQAGLRARAAACRTAGKPRGLLRPLDQNHHLQGIHMEKSSSCNAKHRERIQKRLDRLVCVTA
jgi:hypothetical protein